MEIDRRAFLRLSLRLPLLTVPGVLLAACETSIRHIQPGEWVNRNSYRIRVIEYDPNNEGLINADNWAYLHPNFIVETNMDVVAWIRPGSILEAKGQIMGEINNMVVREKIDEIFWVISREQIETLAQNDNARLSENADPSLQDYYYLWKNSAMISQPIID